MLRCVAVGIIVTLIVLASDRSAVDDNIILVSSRYICILLGSIYICDTQALGFCIRGIWERSTLILFTVCSLLCCTAVAVAAAAAAAADCGLESGG